MSQQAARNELPNDWGLDPEFLSILEMAHEHFLNVHGREPHDGESIFDQEPPSGAWPSSLLNSGQGD